MRANIEFITKRLSCSTEQAEAVENYIDQNNMLDWSEDSARVISTIARAVHDHLTRGEVTKAAEPAPEPKVEKPKAKAKSKPAKKADKAPKPGTKIAHAMLIYKSCMESELEEHHSRQSIISAIANSMQIDRHKAAGYYQSCKRKLG